MREETKTETIQIQNLIMSLLKSNFCKQNVASSCRSGDNYFSGATKQQQVRKYLTCNQVAFAIKLSHYPFKQTTGIGNNSQ